MIRGLRVLYYALKGKAIEVIKRKAGYIRRHSPAQLPYSFFATNYIYHVY